MPIYVHTWKPSGKFNTWVGATSKIQSSTLLARGNCITSSLLFLTLGDTASKSTGVCGIRAGIVLNLSGVRKGKIMLLNYRLTEHDL